MSSEDTTAEKKVHQCTEDHDHKHDHEHGHDHKHEHKHDHDKCNSPHEHDSDSGDDVDDGKKGNRGEKKFKKAMNKLGMKPISGINRVTIRKGKNLLLYIDNPEILKSPGVDNSYIIFGEAKINDFAQNLASSEANKFKPEAANEVQSQQTQASTATNVSEGDSENSLDESGLEPEAIKMVMEHGKCTKAQAIQALRETNGDTVNAIVKFQD